MRKTQIFESYIQAPLAVETRDRQAVTKVRVVILVVAMVSLVTISSLAIYSGALPIPLFGSSLTTCTSDQIMQNFSVVQQVPVGSSIPSRSHNTSTTSNCVVPTTTSIASSVIASSVGNPVNAISASSLFSAYGTNQASADAQYTGKTFDITGAVSSVENLNGSYASCINQRVSTYDCEYLQEFGGYIIWYWQSQSAAKVPVGCNFNNPASCTNFVAQCTVGGFQNSNLILNNCRIVP